jgi:hypothetical protein
MNLDFVPSPSPENPGLFIRDPYRFSDAMLIVPPPLVECLECFNGRQTDLDLRAALVRITGSFEVEEISRNLVRTRPSRACRRRSGASSPRYRCARRRTPGRRIRPNLASCARPWRRT